MNPLVLSLAYRFVAFSLMLATINSFCERAGIRLGQPFGIEDIREGSNVGPAFSDEISGSVLTGQYFFGFGKGHLANFWRHDFKVKGEANLQARNSELAKQSSLVDSNGAFRIATNWLSALGLDCGTLELKYRRETIQWRYYPEGPEGKAMPLPIFQVQWMGNILRNSPRERAAVSVTILGTTTNVVEHHVLDDSLFRTPKVRINDRQQLQEIPDEQFRRYTAAQKSNLVARFSHAMATPASTNTPASKAR